MLRIRNKRHAVILQIVLTLMVIPYLFPLIQMVIGSLGGRGFQNYVAVWETGVIPTYFRNSLIIAACVCALVFILTMTASYGFAKLKIPFKEGFFWLILVALTLPEVILLTPLFVTFQKLKLFNTYFAVILPIAALQLPFSIMITRNFIAGIPTELMEAARIDGAGVGRIFLDIILPLSKPIAASVMLLTLISSWNSYLIPLLFLQSPNLQTITLLPQFFQGEYANDQTKILAAAVITALPTIITFIFLQKSFETGMSQGALK